MSTNLRKAQKHMQRARELLNQSQLGFGVETRSRSNKRKIAEEITCGICLEDITDKDMADVHYCHPVENKVDSTIKTVPEHWFCKDCLEQWINAGYDNCPNCKGLCIALLTKNKVRLRSIPQKELTKVLNEKQMNKVNESQKEIMEKLNNPAELPSIDITLKIEQVRHSHRRNEIRLECTLDQDNNGNFELIQKAHYDEWTKQNKGRLAIVEVQNVDSEQEYWKIINNGTFICSAGFKWTDIIKILRMSNERKRIHDRTRVKLYG